jgi:hypothetical protein
VTYVLLKRATASPPRVQSRNGLREVAHISPSQSSLGLRFKPAHAATRAGPSPSRISDRHRCQGMVMIAIIGQNNNQNSGAGG